jgi:predicted nucleic acid-binding Zn finger protein
MSTAYPAATDAENGIDDRDRRALLEALLVEPLAPGMYAVYSEDGREYVVDTDGGACTCPDFRYREVECKHLRRARLEAGDADTTTLAERIDDDLVAIDERMADLAARRAGLRRLRTALARFE